MPDLNTTHDGPVGACSPIEAIEAIAAGRTPTEIETRHFSLCPSCRAALDGLRDHLHLHHQLRAALGRDDAENADAPEVLIPGYRILSEISRGSQGVVYKAVQERTKRVVAVKMLLGGAFATDRQRARFEREVEIVAGLNHPGIVTVYDRIPVRGGRYAYAMEYIDASVPLDAWRPAAGQSPRDETRRKLSLLADICDAVNHAHQHGVIHRDLKPANILVDSSNRPHVLDFGIAKAIDADLPGHTLTLEFAGTLAYASPEQVAGRPGAVDVRSDVYSLGVILFELLSGRLPHRLEGLSIAEAAQTVTQESPVRLAAVNRAWRGDLDTIAAKALERDPARRYQSAAALASDIRRHLSGRTIEARRDSSWYVLRRTLARRWGAVAAAGALTLLLIGSGAVIAYTRLQEQLARSREANEHARAAAEAVRVTAISSVLREILPPRRVQPFSEQSQHVDYGMLRLQGKLQLGYVAHDPEQEAVAQMMLGAAYRDRGILPSAEEALRLAIHRFVALHGERHPAVAQVLHDLAGVLVDRQRIAEAEVLCGQALDMRLQLLGANDPKTAESRELRARICFLRGRASEALDEADLGVQALTGDAQGELLLAQCLDTKANVLLSLDRAAEAEAVCRRALAIRMRSLSDDDPDLGASLNRLAQVLDARGEAAESRELVHVAGLSTVGELATQLRRIAITLTARNVEDWRAELRYAERSDTSIALAQLLALKRAVVGPRSRAVGQTLATIGWRLTSCYKAEAATAALLEAVSILRDEFGQDDLVVANCLEHLATTLCWSRKFDESIECSREQLRILRAQPVAPLERINGALCQRDMARVLTWAGRHDEAITNFREVIAELAASCGPNHHSRGLALSQCSRSLLALGRTEEAAALAREGRHIALLNPALPLDQRGQVDANLAFVLEREGKIDEAEALLIPAREMWWETTGVRDDMRTDPDFVAIVAALVRISLRRGDLQSALTWWSELPDD